MTTTVTVVGTIATDPKLSTPASGVPICSFRLASDERRYDREKQTWVDGNTNWFGIACFRGLATHAHESFKKGERVILHGKMRMRDWQKDDGTKGRSVELEADAIGHDVRFGVSKFERRTLTQQHEAEGEDQAAALPTPDASEAEPATPLHTSGGEPSVDGFTPELAQAA